MLNLMLFVDGFGNISPVLQPRNPSSQEIYHQTIIQGNVLQIGSLTLESAQHKPEQLLPDTGNISSKLFKL